jgi:solute carrier family 25 protein 38
MPAQDLIAGSLSGFVSCVLLQPLEVIKTRLQQQTMALHSPSPALANIVAPATSPHSGSVSDLSTFREIMKPLIAHPANLWRGTVPTILRNVPGVSIYFYSLSFIRQTFIPQATRASRSRKYVTLVNVGAGMLARAGAGFILMPISVIKVRFESNLYNYKTLAEASADIIKREGPRGFFSGFGATALRDAPYAGIQVGIYEGTKALLGGM